MKKKIGNYFFKIITTCFFMMSLYFVIQFIEGLSHNYQNNKMKYDESKIFLETVCSSQDLLVWPEIYEPCRQKKEIMKRNPLWETIVDTSNMLHICYKKKQLHDENKIFGHDHAKKENEDVDQEIDCSKFIVFLAGCFTIIIVILYYLNFCRNKENRIKKKRD